MFVSDVRCFSIEVVPSLLLLLVVARRDDIQEYRSSLDTSECWENEGTTISRVYCCTVVYCTVLCY